MENIDMAICAEIAKIVVSKVSEEELKKRAESVLYRISNESIDYWNRNTQVEEIAKRIFLSKLEQEITNAFQDEEFKKKLKNMAYIIRDEIVNETKNKLIDQISNRLSGYIVDPYGTTTNIINQVFKDVLDKNRGY
ncbi:hypothetical protein [Thermosipho sp. (in: thermotogales)]|jgi:hypothetical protein|uniref:hypothetical protein n=1 Tax=Thermosipho sp. (in: thermotogales) TaxID=1968895 RepID=UPI00257CB30A|nr:hypothetical protein [Thermosipho sp. (in: thermotogales)]MBZ4649152.1 hypothetical protein [Thermosipho sp. (in: thermotogales)]